MSYDIKSGIRRYAEALDEAVRPVGLAEAMTVSDARDEEGSRSPRRNRRAAWVFAAGAAAAVAVLIGGVAWLVRTPGETSSIAGPVVGISADDCPWVATTLGPDRLAPPCPTPETREEMAIASAYRVLGAERFAGLWYEAPGSDVLVLGYVGDEPDLGQFPGVDRLVKREMSLAEMEALVAARNAEEGDSGFFWRVNVVEGIVEREATGVDFNPREDDPWCSDTLARMRSGEVPWHDLSIDEQERLSLVCGVGRPVDG